MGAPAAGFFFVIGERGREIKGDVRRERVCFVRESRGARSFYSRGGDCISYFIVDSRARGRCEIADVVPVVPHEWTVIGDYLVGG